MSEKIIDENTSLLSLTWPIFIEILAYMLIGNIDIMMLSKYSDNAVAAVGNANQILNILIIMFNIIAISTGILISQYLGANNREKISEIYSVAIFINLLFSLILSVVLAVGGSKFYELINLPESLMHDAIEYTNIVGGFLFIQASFMIMSVIFKSNGIMKPPMYIAIGMNILNIIGNYMFLFGLFGTPILGIKGVAISSIFSRTIGLLVLIYLFKKNIPGNISVKALFPFPKEIFNKMLKVGIPSAGEQMSYNLSQIVISAFINILGTMVITTRMYVQTLTWFTFLATSAITQATQTIVGHLIGAKKENEANKIVMKSLKISMLMSTVVAIAFAIFGNNLLGLFTDNISIIKLGGIILMIDVILEPGRAINIVIANSMRTAGDVKFPVAIGVVSMWTITVLGAYTLGVKFQLGLIGIWIVMAAEEWIRGLIMLHRWKKGKWRGKRLV